MTKRPAIICAPQTDWYDISTAPKDGTRVWLWASDFGEVIGWWSEETPDYHTGELGCWVSEWTVHCGKLEDYSTDIRMVCGMTPTHWQPASLPPISAGCFLHIKSQMIDGIREITICETCLEKYGVIKVLGVSA